MSKRVLNFAVIGSGPVGLYSTFMLLNSFICNITVFDKRAQYSRNQIFVINKEHTDILPNKIKKELFELGCFIEPPFTTMDADCTGKKNGRNFSCKISDFEKMLKRYLETYWSEKVFFVNENVSENRVNTLIANFDMVLGCEGSESTVSKYLGFDKIYYPELESQGIGVIFEFKKSPEKRNVKYRQELFRGFTTPNGDGYLGIRLSKEQYEAFKKNPKSPQVTSMIDLGMKYYNFTDYKVTSTFGVDVKPFYKEQVISISNDGRINVLLGDSAIGIHYFTGSGVNFGFQMVNDLIRSLTRVIFTRPTKKNIDTLFRSYQSKYSKIVESNLQRINFLHIPEELLIRSCKNTPLDFLIKRAKNLGIRESFIKATTKEALCVLLFNDLYKK
jgi:2-polyprenyl-6-methoxyphenol hydroxylase-like FAD-dependent oxidoreductase